MCIYDQAPLDLRGVVVQGIFVQGSRWTMQSPVPWVPGVTQAGMEEDVACTPAFLPKLSQTPLSGLGEVGAMLGCRT